MADLTFDSDILIERGKAPKQMPEDKASRIDWTTKNRTYFVNEKGEEVRYWFLPSGYQIPKCVYGKFLADDHVVGRLDILGQLGQDALDTMRAKCWISPLNAEWFCVTRKARSELDLV